MPGRLDLRQRRRRSRRCSTNPWKAPSTCAPPATTLPDLVAALHSGKIDIDLDGRIDSVKGGRIRNTFEAVPDAPVTRFALEMQGGKKGLLVNRTNLCEGDQQGDADFTGQNGKVADFNPVAEAAGCGAKAKKKAKAKASAPSACRLRAW